MMSDFCTGCGAPNCSELWKDGRKCCPDCSHRRRKIVRALRERLDLGPECDGCGASVSVLVEFTDGPLGSVLSFHFSGLWGVDVADSSPGTPRGTRLLCPECVRKVEGP